MPHEDEQQARKYFEYMVNDTHLKLRTKEIEYPDCQIESISLGGVRLRIASEIGSSSIVYGAIEEATPLPGNEW